MNIRQVKSEDYHTISPLLNDWWGGRHMSHMLPKLFFEHFSDTSFVAEKNGETVGFLIGFLSQSRPGEAYVHFAGVHPEFRKHRIGKCLYDEFFRVAERNDCHTIRCITSPVNKTSIAYHTKIGFEMEPGDKNVDGVPVHSEYDGPGGDRVLFMKEIN